MFDNRQLIVKVYAQSKVLDLKGYHVYVDVNLIRSKREPNKARIEIYNLGKENRGVISGDHQAIEILAGYDSPGMIFQGVTVSVTPESVRPDRLTIVEAVDGGQRWSSSWYSGSWDEGTALRFVLADVAGAMGLPIEVHATGVLAAPRVAHGRPKDLLTEICLDYNLHWDIYHGVIEVTGEDETFDRSTIPMVSLTPQNGLVGSPTIEELEPKRGRRRWGLVAQCLMNPHIRPNGYIQVGGSLVTGATIRDRKGRLYERPGANGLFRVTRVGHHGGLHLNEFYTDIEGEYLA